MGYWKQFFLELAEDYDCSFEEAVERYEEELEFQRESEKEDRILRAMEREEND